MKKGARLGWILAVAVFLAAAFWQPDRTLQGASEGLLLWYTKVLPVQFPFVTGARLWLRLGVQERLGARLETVMRRVFRLPGCAGAVWAAGLLAGYPSGAFFAAKLYEEGRMTDSETLTLTLLANTAGPLFVAGTVGTALLHNVRMGWCLLGIHWISAILTAWLNRPAKTAEAAVNRSRVPQGETELMGTLLGQAAQEAAGLMVRVGEFIVLFSVIVRLCPLPERNGWEGMAAGLLEITGGIARLSGGTDLFGLRFAAISFLLGFSGFSVLMQSAAVMPASLPRGRFLRAKLLQGGISALLGAAAWPMFFV